MATQLKARTRNTWGRVRQLPSKKFQASYTHPRNGRVINAPNTFSTKTAAQQWLAAQRTFLEAGSLPVFEREAAIKQ